MVVDRHRAGSWSRQQARRLHLEFVRDRWLPLAATIAVLGGCVALVAVTAPDRPAPYLVGAGAASKLWFVGLITVQIPGTTRYVLGSQGEQRTSGVLRRLRSRGWVLLDHVPLARGDIDHAIVGPGGAYAVETRATHGS